MFAGENILYTKVIPWATRTATLFPVTPFFGTICMTSTFVSYFKGMDLITRSKSSGSDRDGRARRPAPWNRYRDDRVNLGRLLGDRRDLPHRTDRSTQTVRKHWCRSILADWRPIAYGYFWLLHLSFLSGFWRLNHKGFRRVRRDLSFSPPLS